MPAALADALAAALAADPARVLLVFGDSETATPSLHAHPTRTISCGRGEQTAVLAAVGLAAEGFRPIVLMHAPLATGRGAALFDALAAHLAPDVLLVLRGALPPGVAAPNRGATTTATDDRDAAEQLPKAVAGTGPRVLRLP